MQRFDSILKMSRLSKKNIEKYYGSFTKSNVIKKKIGTYIKSDTSSYSKFLDNVNTIEKFLTTLSGIHKDAIKNIKVKFVSPKYIKSKARYSTKDDIILINVSKLGNTRDEYGSLLYVVLHELGHRYLRYNRQNWNYDSSEYATTKYSMADSMTGEEKFAELFAMSHWPNKYKEYSDKINKFLDKVK